MSTIRRETARLRTAFRSALSLALVAEGACSTSSTPSAPPVDTVDAGDAAVVDVSVPDAAVDARCDSLVFTPAPPDTCGDYIRLPCGLPKEVVPRANCYLTLNDCAALCPDIQFNCRVIEPYCLDGGTVAPDDAGSVVVDCATCPTGVGRTPIGLVPCEAKGRGLGAYFSEAAYLEAASVRAFRILERELVRHRAPRDLVVASRAAAKDEARHARAMGRLARRHGGRYGRPRVEPVPERSLEEVAIDNMVEGCVRETFGALVIAAQAERVSDGALAKTLGSVAEDELAHAALSWSIASWMETELEAEEAARVRAAGRRAIAALKTQPIAAHAVALGVGPREIEAFVAALASTVWAPLFAAA